MTSTAPGVDKLFARVFTRFAISLTASGRRLSSRTKSFSSLLVLSQLAAGSGTALAGDFSFTGTFAVDDRVQTFEFTLNQAQTVTIRTLGHSGGTNAAGQTLTGGGFDTIVTLFGADGAWIASNDDGPSCCDSQLISSLAAGRYTLALSQYANFATGDNQPGGNLSDGFTGAASSGFSGRSSFWAIDFLNTDNARQLNPAEAHLAPPDADHFLTFFSAVSPAHEENEATARAYYDMIDPGGTKTTLSAWKTANGFDGGADGDAIYVNDADLGFGRHMYVKTLANGVASYVENYSANTPDPGDPGGGPLEEKITNAHNGTNLLATVAMEYTAHPNDPANRLYTKFYVFGSDGSRLTRIDLDGRGVKFVPGACNVCHGGNPRPLKTDGTYADFGDTGAGFLPWDLDVLGFSDTLFGGQYSRANQEVVLKTFNTAVLQTNPTDAAREIIEGWYGGPTLPDPAFNELFVPTGWQSQPNYYLDVIGPNCRACHIMRNPAVDFSTSAGFQALETRINQLVFDRGVMPLAKRTYERFWQNTKPGVSISRSSTDSAGNESDNANSGPAISADGRYVAFVSFATDLVANDTNGLRDVFLKDTQTGIITRVNTDSAGNQSNDDSFYASISADGRYVAFQSDASNLVANDTNGVQDVFLKDTQSGITTRLSTDSGGNQGNSYSYNPIISSDGRHATFFSIASDLVGGDTNGVPDVFLKDTQTGVTTRLSTDSAGNQGNSYSYSSSINADGRYVAFHSDASNLVAGDSNGATDAFLKDTQSGVTTRLSTDSAGNQGNGSSFEPAISADGRYIAFYSDASDLVIGDSNGVRDVFLKDIQTGLTTRISTDSTGNQSDNTSYEPTISADGRYVAFSSYASNLAGGDTNGVLDVFLKDTQTGVTTRLSTDSAGNQGDDSSVGPVISADGRYVTFASASSNLVAGDTNGFIDIFTYDSITSVAVTAAESTIFTAAGSRAPGNDSALAFAGVDAPALLGFPFRLDASDSLFPNAVSGLSGLEWTLVSQPAGSGAALINPTAEQPEFTPDVAGDYDFQLLARNGIDLTVDTVRLSATTDGAATGVDFATQVEPIINGCTSCHTGGSAPAFDAPQIDSLSEAIYRNVVQRVDVSNPEWSLLLRKATAQINHGGGQRFTTGSPEYLTLVRWINEGAARTPLLSAPINDDFADASTLTGSSGTQQATNINATKQPDEPFHAFNDGGKSVWWQWTAPVNGNVEISTLGSDFDTLLAVYTGSGVDALTTIASNDDDIGATSRVNFPVTAGTTYLIAVDGYHYGGEPEARSGNVQLNWDFPPPANDTFSQSSNITGASGVVGGSNSGATEEAGEPDHAGNAGGASVWFTWTPSASGTYTIDTIGSDFDTLLAIYTGTSINALTEVASDDDSGGSGTSRVSINAVAGQQYQIAIDGYNAGRGNFVLNWNEIVADGDLNLDGLVNAADVLIGQRILTGDLIPTPLQLTHGDVAPLSGGLPTPDGQFTLGDLVVIQRKALGEISF